MAGGEATEEEWVLHGFTATVQHDGAPREISLDGPVTTRTSTGELVQAYLLTLGAGGGKFERHFYLDDKLRVIRENSYCDDPERHCEHYESTWWNQAGRVAPYGIGLPTLLEQGVEHAFAGQQEFLDFEVIGRDPLVVEIESRDLVSGVPGRSTLQYAAEQMVPSYGDFEVVSYAAGDPLPRVDEWTPTGIVAPTTVSNEVFPGADVDFMDHGITFQQFVDGFYSTTMGSEALAAGACLRSILVPVEGSAKGLGAEKVADIKMMHAGQVTTYEVTATNLSVRFDFKSEVTGRKDTIGTCAEVDESPPPVLDLPAAYQQVRDAAWSFDQIDAVVVDTWIGASYGRREPSLGSWDYMVVLRPSFVVEEAKGSGVVFVSYESYQANFDPHRGTLAFTGLAPGDI